MEYEGAFDKTLEEFTNSYKLSKVKTTDFGSPFELIYEVIMKEQAISKKLIDKLRCLNGNMKIVLMAKESGKEIAF
jgi:hypothetical protein